MRVTQIVVSTSLIRQMSRIVTVRREPSHLQDPLPVRYRYYILNFSAFQPIPRLYRCRDLIFSTKQFFWAC